MNLDRSYALNKNSDLLSISDYNLINPDIGPNSLIDRLYEEFIDLAHESDWNDDDN